MVKLAIYLKFVTSKTRIVCGNCYKTGHIAKVCKSQEPPQQQAPQRHYSSRPCQQPQQCSTPQQARYIEGEISENTMTDSNEWNIFTVHSQLEITQPSISFELQINNVEVVSTSMC